MYGAKNCLVLLHHGQTEEEDDGHWRGRAGKEKTFPRVVVHQEAHGDRAKVVRVEPSAST